MRHLLSEVTRPCTHHSTRLAAAAAALATHSLIGSLLSFEYVV